VEVLPAQKDPAKSKTPIKRSGAELLMSICLDSPPSNVRWRLTVPILDLWCKEKSLKVKFNVQLWLKKELFLHR
jgi:hypothetical protein